MSELLLLCTIAGQRVALPALRVESVIDVSEITPIPGTPDFIAGLTALRSQALTVIDCARAIGLPYADPRGQCRAAVIESAGHLYALMLESAETVGEALSRPFAVPGGFGERWRRVADGLIETGEGPALLIDVERLIGGPQPMAA